MDYLKQYKEKKTGMTTVPRKSLLKQSITTARLPQGKPKIDLLEVGKKQKEERRGSGVSPKVVSPPGGKSATAKPTISSFRKK